MESKAWRKGVRGKALAALMAAAFPLIVIACSPGPGGEGEPRIGPDEEPPDAAAAARREPSLPATAPAPAGADQPAGAGGEPRTDPGTEPDARANLRPTEGNSANGLVEFRNAGQDNAGQDGVSIRVEIAGLAPGAHGLHLHETGDCSAPDASSAGEHYAPGGRPHGAPSAEAHHAGDLGNIEADASGIAVADITSEELIVGGAHAPEGRYPVEDRAVIVHAGADDFLTQPDGAAGDRVACGIIEIIEEPAAPA